MTRGIRCERGHLSELPPGVRATHCPVPVEAEASDLPDAFGEVRRRPCGLPVVPAIVPPGAGYPAGGGAA